MPGIADAGASQAVRPDAIARWLQDVAYEDLVDSGIEQRGLWVIRRLRLRVERFPRFGERAELVTFCSGIGRFAAERRTTVRAGGEVAVEAVALWVWLDAETLRPLRFPAEFVELYGESAAGREAPVRLRHPEPPPAASSRPFAFRAADLDIAGHVNNSHYWAPLAEELGDGGPAGLDAEVEFREPAGAGPVSVLAVGPMRWIAAPDGTLHASILLAEGLG